MTGAGEPPIDGLLAVLERLDRILSRAVQRLVHAVGDQAAADPFRGLYISVHDATRMAEDSRWSPLLGVADAEPPVMTMLDPASRLAVLATDHGLTSFDVDVLAIALAPEIDLGYGRLYAFLQDDVSRRRPSVDLALNLLCPTIDAKLARREHFAADAPLICADLLELVADPAAPSGPLLAQVLDVDDAVVRHVLGVGGPDPRLRRDCALVEPALTTGAPRAPWPGSDRLVAEAQAQRTPLRLYFSGPADGDKRRGAEWLAAEAGAPLLVARLGGLASAADDLRSAIRRLLREAHLQRAVVLIEELDALDEGGGRGLRDALARHRGVVILAGAGDRPPPGNALGGVVRVPFPIPGHAERRSAWQAALGAGAAAIGPHDVDALAGASALRPTRSPTPPRRRGTRRGAVGPGRSPRSASCSRPRATAPTPRCRAWRERSSRFMTADQLRAARGDAAPSCARCASRSSSATRCSMRGASAGACPSAGGSARCSPGRPARARRWPPRCIAARARPRPLQGRPVARWSASTSARPRRTSRGSSTRPRRRTRSCSSTRPTPCSASASRCSDAHDRYANIEVAYLLQRMEQYEGVVDPGDQPAQEHRRGVRPALRSSSSTSPSPTRRSARAIWAPCCADERRADRTSTSTCSAGSSAVRRQHPNIVLAAAFLAAGDGEPIGMAHLLRALRRELQKMGKVLSTGRGSTLPGSWWPHDARARDRPARVDAGRAAPRGAARSRMGCPEHACRAA